MDTTSRSVYSPLTTRLPNGIPVIVDRVPSVDSCAVGIWVRAGTRDEPRSQAGVAHFVEHTSFRRTPGRTTQRIARDFENVGAYANAYTTKEETCYYVRTLREHLPAVFRTLADVVLNPVFDPKDVEKERTIITEEIRSYEDEAEEFIFDTGEGQMFGRHPLGVPIVGTVDSVAHITADDVRNFHARHYHAGSLIVTVSGNVDPEEFIALAERTLTNVRPRGRALSRKVPPSLATSSLTMERPVQQAHILWQVRVPGHRDSERFALMLLNTALGDGMSSRLNVRLRERKGLAYNVYSQLQLFVDCGIFAIYAGVEEQRRDRALAVIDEELALVAREGLRPTELRRAKEQLRAGKIMSLESLTARMTMLGKGMFEDGIPEDPYATIDRINAVTIDDVNAAARRWCRPDRWSRCLILPSPSDD